MNGNLKINSKDEFFKYLLEGKLKKEEIEKNGKKYSLPNLTCFACIINVNGRTEETIGLILAYGNDEYDYVYKTDENSLVLIKFLDDFTKDYHSVNEYVRFLNRVLEEEIGVKARFFSGEKVSDIYSLNKSYEECLAVKNSADKRQNTDRILFLKDFAFSRIMGAVDKNKLGELREIGSQGIVSVCKDKELLKTAKIFLEEDLNVLQTAKKLYVHRNTLNYRLNKIEGLTGLNLRKLDDAITFKMLTYLVGKE